MTRPAATCPAATRAALARLRPQLLAGYDAALPGARAAVLARLWGALAREPLPQVTARRRAGADLTVTLADGRRVTGAAAHAEPFAPAAAPLHLAGPAAGRGVPVADPAALVRALPGDTGRLADELDDSVANLALARAGAAPAPRLAELARLDRAAALARAEQAVVDGHPLHPCCRTRAGMSPADVLAYAPEHAPLVYPVRLRVPARRWRGDGPPVLLAHPWQATRLLATYPWLVHGGHAGAHRPLMSLRTLAPVDGGAHLKTAVDVQMTSAVRTVSPAAVHNGPRLSAVLPVLTADLPVDVLTEHGGGAVLVDGAPHRRLAHLHRAAPRPGAGAVVLPLATLPAAPALYAEVVAGHGGDPRRWLRALLSLLLPPLFTLLHRGVAAEAHGQNTLVVLHGTAPVRVLYRDLGGVRVHPGRLGDRRLDLRGDLCTDDVGELRTTLTAALLAGVVAEHVAALARHHHTEPGQLWRVAARVLAGHGGADVAAVLGAPLPVKATTAMRLATDPLHPVWAGVDNPLAAA